MADGVEWFGDDFVPEKRDDGQDTRFGSGSFNFITPYVGFVTIKALTEMKKKPNFSKITRLWHMPYITAFFKMYINQCTAHVQKRGETNQLVGLKGLGIKVVQGEESETHQTQIREVRELLVCNPLGETTDATIIQRQAELVATKRTILPEMQQYVKKCAYFMLKEVLHKDILQEVKTYGAVP